MRHAQINTTVNEPFKNLGGETVCGGETLMSKLAAPPEATKVQDEDELAILTKLKAID